MQPTTPLSSSGLKLQAFGNHSLKAKNIAKTTSKNKENFQKTREMEMKTTKIKYRKTPKVEEKYVFYT